MKALRLEFLVLAILGLFITSCDDPICIRGKGPIVSQVININNSFSKIEMEGSFDVIISYGNNLEVEATGHQNVIDELITSVVGDELILELDKRCIIDNDLTINITIPYLTKVTLDGSGDILINDFLNQYNLELELMGSGDMVFNEFTGTENLYIKIEGSGEVKGNKHFPDINIVDVRISGSGDYSGFPIKANECNVSISGSGTAKIHANDILNVTIDGSGDVLYQGNPTLSQSISGSGDVINRN
jgi:hypothetical protein